MGFRQAIVISEKVDSSTRENALLFAQTKWPGIRLPSSPRQYRDRILFAAPELTDYLFDSDSEYERAVSTSYEIAEGVTALSTNFPNITYAHIDADCFGGTCIYSGFTIRNGTEILSVRGQPTGHKQLLRQIGFRMWYNCFAPFVRGYLANT